MRRAILVFLSIAFGSYIQYGDIENISSYLVLLILPFFLIVFFRRSDFGNVSQSGIWLIFTLISFLCFSIANNYLNGINPLSGVFWWFIFLLMLITDVSKSQIHISSKTFIFTAIVILSIDTYYRFFISTKNLEYGFYAYKYGLIGVDSNFSGIFAMLIAIIYDQIFLREMPFSWKRNIIFILIVVLLFSTFSRAAIIGFICYIFLYRISSKYKYAIGMFAIMFSIASLYKLDVFFFNGDESGSSKFRLAVEYAAYFFNSSWDLILFGYGLGGLKVGDYNPHLLPLQVLTGYGTVGFILYYAFISCMLLRYNKAKFIIIPYLIVSMSVAPIGVGILIFTLYILIRLDDDNCMLLCR
ncbi:TPA: hypothetical protein ACVU01_003479 [Vibrio cholerae]|uniref:hypothetical protein n=1 Tax=Vibrio cholerae TaxID=666 RepID=UPI002856329E|nr:hypothetical protein [Vibrio cholerae]ELE5867254.1 hypothetical protein [Vibrio cholerae]ELG7083321.1 hypothetical protein [Vibrio cholerae]